MKIAVVLGSTRPGRVGERVAKWVAAAAKSQPEFEVDYLDLADFDLPQFNEPISPRFNPNRQAAPNVQRWLDAVATADGFVVVTPEYNHSIPGVLKNAIDFLDFQMAKKPAAIVSYGTVGGARAAEHLKNILVEAKAAVVPEAIALLNAGKDIDEAGGFVGDTANPYGPDKQITTVLGELAWWTATLKAGRKAS